MIQRILNHFGYYKIEQLQIGAHCGCCGAWIPDEIIEKDWSWSICKNCLGELNMNYKDRNSWVEQLPYSNDFTTEEIDEYIKS